MDLALLISSIVVIVLGSIVFFGAPFVPTKKVQINVALDLLNLKRGDLLVDLGAGDGRVALAAAKRGIRSRSYELNGLLVLIAKVRTWRYRSLVSIKWQNYWRADVTDADGVFIFSAERFMGRLDKKLIESGRRLKLASFAFKVPGKKQSDVSEGVFLYHYSGGKQSGMKRKL